MELDEEIEEEINEIISISELTSENNTTFTSNTIEFQQCDLKFIVSPWSTPCLVINNFIYNCHSTRGDKGYWRCHNYSRKRKEERCKARCVIVDGMIKSLTGGEHNHPPHTDKINKITKRNDLYEESLLKNRSLNELQLQQQHHQQ